MSDTKLNAVERRDLKKLENVIEKGMSQFLQVGYALQQINREGLYRENYPTFSKYLKDRWDMSTSQGYRLIDCAEVDQQLKKNVPHGGQTQPKLPPILTSERVYRELAKVPEEKVVDVYNKVIEVVGDDDPAVTYNIVKKTVSEYFGKDVEKKAKKQKKKKAAAKKSPKKLGTKDRVFELADSAYRTEVPTLSRKLGDLFDLLEDEDTEEVLESWDFIIGWLKEKTNRE